MARKPKISELTTSPDVQTPPLPELPAFAVDPVDTYLRIKHNVYCRRQVVWDAFEACADAHAIANAVAGLMISHEIVIIPTTANPDDSDRRAARQAMNVLHNALGTQGGLINLIHSFVDAYWGSVTGWFPEFVKDRRGDIVEIGVIDPIKPHPFYEIGPRLYYDAVGVKKEIGEVQAAGVWWIDGTISTMLRKGFYAQVTQKAYGRGGFLVGRPVCEDGLTVLVESAAFDEYIRRSLMGLDSAQVLVLRGINVNAFLEQMAARKQARLRRSLNPEDQGNVLIVTARSPTDDPIVKSTTLRAVPEGVDVLQLKAMYQHRLASQFGVRAWRVDPDIESGRFGNATQAAQQDANESGRLEVEAAFLNFLNNTYLADKPLRALWVGADDPTNYVRAQFGATVAQTISQLSKVFDGEVLKKYAVDMGLLSPSMIGSVVVTSAEGTVPVASKEITPEMDQAMESCQAELAALFNAWLVEDVDDFVDELGINQSLLADSLDDLAALLIAAALACLKKKTDAKTRKSIWYLALVQVIRDGIANLIGSPRVWVDNGHLPLYPLYSVIMDFSPRLLAGLATIEDLKNKIATFKYDVEKYGRMSNAAGWLDQGLKSTGLVRWIRTVFESCDDCVAFEGSYDSFNDLLARTGGILPQDVRLQDRGACRCYLEFSQMGVVSQMGVA